MVTSPSIVWEDSSAPATFPRVQTLRFTHLELVCPLPTRSVPPATVTWGTTQPPDVVSSMDGRLLFSAADVPLQGETYTCTVSNPVSAQSVQRSFTVFDVDSLDGGKLAPPCLRSTP